MRNESRAIRIFSALSDIDEDIILETRPPIAPSAPMKNDSRLSRVLSSGWVAAGLSVVVALGVIIAIVLAGRSGDPGLPPAGTAEPESESVPVLAETIPDSVPETAPVSEAALETIPETVPETQPETQAETDPPPSTVTVVYNGLVFACNGADTATLISVENIDSVVLVPDALPSGARVVAIGPDAFLQSAVTVVTLPNGLIEIGDRAFAGCRSLSSIFLPEGLTAIGESAFSESGLRTISVPANVTDMGETVFKGCSDLTSVMLDAEITAIPDGTFSGCTSLASVTLREDITALGNHVFENCTALSILSLPATLSRIGEDAFVYCENLTHIRFGGSVEAWCAIRFGAHAEEYQPRCIIHCTDGNVILYVNQYIELQPDDPYTMRLPEGATLDSAICIQQGKARYLRVCELTVSPTEHRTSDRAVYIDLFNQSTGEVYGRELFYGHVTVFSDRDRDALGIVHFEGRRDEQSNAPVLLISCGLVCADNGLTPLLSSEMWTEEMTLLDFRDRGVSDELADACDQLYNQFIQGVFAWNDLRMEVSTDPTYHEYVYMVNSPTPAGYLQKCTPIQLWNGMFAEGNATTLSSLPLGTLNYATVTAITSYKEILLTPIAHDGTQGRILVRTLGVEGTFESHDVLGRGVYQDMVDLTTGTRISQGIFNGDIITFFNGEEFFDIYIAPWRTDESVNVVNFLYYTSELVDIGPEFGENTVEWNIEASSSSPWNSDYSWLPDKSASVQIYREAFGYAANFLKKNDDAVMIVCTNENFAAYLAGREPTAALLRAYAEACPPQAVWDSYFPPEDGEDAP